MIAVDVDAPQLSYPFLLPSIKFVGLLQLIRNKYRNEKFAQLFHLLFFELDLALTLRLFVGSHSLHIVHPQRFSHFLP